MEAAVDGLAVVTQRICRLRVWPGEIIGSMVRCLLLLLLLLLLLFDSDVKSTRLPVQQLYYINN